MLPEELTSIINNALLDTGVTATTDAISLMIDLAAQFPAPVQMLGYHAFRLNTDNVITYDDMLAARDFVVQDLKRQEFEGRLERTGAGLKVKILKALASVPGEGVTLETVAREIDEERDRVAGMMGGLVSDAPVMRKGQSFRIADPLFQIYLQALQPRLRRGSRPERPRHGAKLGGHRELLAVHVEEMRNV